jgi:hypothetical protein
VPHELVLRDLGQAWRPLPSELRRDLGDGQVVRRDAARAPPAPGLLEDELHLGGHLREHVGEPVDVRGRALLGERDEQDVVEARVVAPQRIAWVDAVRASAPDDLRRGDGRPEGDLLERRAVERDR